MLTQLLFITLVAIALTWAALLYALPNTKAVNYCFATILLVVCIAVLVLLFMAPRTLHGALEWMCDHLGLPPSAVTYEPQGHTPHVE